MCGVFFFSNRRRHTSCALVTGVQTCALPIFDPVHIIGRDLHRSGSSWLARPQSCSTFEPARFSSALASVIWKCDGLSIVSISFQVIGAATGAPSRARALRSEEHTSELQSLMRISYAVFCLKKKNSTPHNSLHLHTLLIQQTPATETPRYNDQHTTPPY